jgi:hypothetical protein
LRRSSNKADRPALFAAQFALSHVCWLLAYPVAGQIGANSGMGVAFLALAAIAAIGTISALWRWPELDPEEIAHEHPELPSDHPHLSRQFPGEHRHAFVIDELHGRWPGRP